MHAQQVLRRDRHAEGQREVRVVVGDEVGVVVEAELVDRRGVSKLLVLLGAVRRFWIRNARKQQPVTSYRL